MTEEYRKASHTIFSINLHICWITKYRYKVLKGEVGQRAKELIRRICNATNISTLVKYLKGKSSRKLQMEFPELKKRYWGQHFWARGYFVCSTGNVTTKMIEEYIKHHFEGEEGKDAFNVQEP